MEGLGAHYLLTAIAIVMLVAAPVGAQDRTTVRLDGRAVFRVGSSDTSSAAERANRIERRLATLLESPRALPPARIERSGTTGQDRVITVSSWGRFGAEVQASAQSAFARLLESAIRVIPGVLAALLVLALFWLLAAGIRRLLRAAFARIIEDRTAESLVKQGAYYAIWTLGLLVAVHALGLQPQTVIAGLGLTGLALGFALKDIISNFVSGILILALRPFELGDQIVVGETEGSVERIELRATAIRTYDGRLVLVPNAEVFTSRVTNNTASPVRRALVPVFLGYGTDLPRAGDVVRAATTGTDGVLAEPPVSVRVADLGERDVKLEALFWTDSRRSDFTGTQARVRAGIVDALLAAGIGLPDPDVRFLVPRHPERWQAALQSDQHGR